VNSSEALKARRDAERAERRRDERLQERADEQAEREREEARAEDRRREEARDEAEARAAEERARERRQERLAQLRKTGLATARQDRKRDERRVLAKRELDDTRRAEVARERAAGERRAEAAEQAATAQRVQEREAAARAERLDQQQAERRAAEGQQERQARREAELRKADADRRASDREGAQAEAERREEQLEEERRRLREERGRSDLRAAEADRLRAEAVARAREERRREHLAADRRAELRSAARTARVRELAAQRAAAQAASERAAELRAEEAARRLGERRELAAREQRDRERRAAAGSERRGELEGAELPWLRTDNGVLVAWGGERVLLRGVSARGLDEAVAARSPLREALALGDRNLEQLSERWGANVVRLPFATETIAAADVMELDELVGALAASRLYTLLAIEPPVAGGETPLPGDEVHRAWRLLAERYQAEPGVLFEPFAAAAPLADGWPAAALALVHTIRSRHQSSLLLLPEQGGELGPVHNLVYTIRLAPDSGTRLDERLTAFAAREAVLVSDWREDGVDPAGPATATAGLLERHQLSWCAGNWNAAPRLVADAAANRLTETRFGLVVRRALAAPEPPALMPF
jgi:hypothetical protein